MQKILLSITDRQYKALKEKSERHGISVSEFVRRIFDVVFCDVPYDDDPFEKKVICPNSAEPNKKSDLNRDTKI